MKDLFQAIVLDVTHTEGSVLTAMVRQALPVSFPYSRLTTVSFAMIVFHFDATRMIERIADSAFTLEKLSQIPVSPSPWRAKSMIIGNTSAVDMLIVVA